MEGVDGIRKTWHRWVDVQRAQAEVGEQDVWKTDDGFFVRCWL